MNRTLLAASLIGAVTLAAAAAQAADPGPTPTTRLPMASGSNWTPTAEGAIARQQIHDAGYNGVTMLQRNSDGTWQGQALKGDTYYTITLDSAGHVTQR